MAINLDQIKRKLDSLQTVTTKQNNLWKPEPAGWKISCWAICCEIQKRGVFIFLCGRESRGDHPSLAQFPDSREIHSRNQGDRKSTRLNSSHT